LFQNGKMMKLILLCLVVAIVFAKPKGSLPIGWLDDEATNAATDAAKDVAQKETDKAVEEARHGIKDSGGDKDYPTRLEEPTISRRLAMYEDNYQGQGANREGWKKWHALLQVAEMERKKMQAANREGQRNWHALLQKRRGKPFTNYQVLGLQNSFRSKKFPSPAEKYQIARKYGLTATQVSQWFSNERFREKHPQPPKKRGRLFTNVQVLGLQNSFRSKKFPSPAEKYQIAREHGLTTTQVSQWFTNERFREKHPQPQSPRKKRPFKSNHQVGQVEELEKRYRLQKNPSRAQRNQYAQELGLTNAQVSKWYRNRHYREKQAKLKNDPKPTHSQSRSPPRSPPHSPPRSPWRSQSGSPSRLGPHSSNWQNKPEE